MKRHNKTKMMLLSVMVIGFYGVTVTKAHFASAFVSVDSLMNLINQTSSIYIPEKKKEPKLEALLSTEEIIRRAGYPVEVHQIYTEDGQMLTLHRIPGPSKYKSGVRFGSKQPVLIMHGFVGSSQIWLQIPHGRSLPYILADEGFDVWLGNFRDNYYSRSHLKYSTKDKRFWDVSFHEMGVYDLPAKIDYILSCTSYPQLIYIGHSMGTTTFLVMGSVRPQYNSKILASFLLSPVALTIRTSQLQPLLSNLLLPAADLIYRSLSKLRLYEIFPKNEQLYKLLDNTCGPGAIQPLCLELIAQGYGENRNNFDLKHLGELVPSLFAGATIKTAHHLSQFFNTGTFRFYDYGAKGNLYKYGSIVPPDYPLSRITAPIYMYYGLGDPLMNTESVNRLAKALPNVLQVNAVEDPKFTHLDFLYGLNAKKILYDKLKSQIGTIVKFNSNFIHPQFFSFDEI